MRKFIQLHRSLVGSIILMMPLVISIISLRCVTADSEPPEAERIPPYLWSICRGSTQDELILSVASEKSFDLLRIDIKTRDVCWLTETDNLDEVLPGYSAEENKLFFVQSDVNPNESNVAVWSMDSSPIKKELVPLSYQVTSVIVYDKDKFYFTGRRKNGLASETELYRCTFHDGEQSIERLTRNSEIEGLAMYVPGQKSIYWYRAGKGDSNLIMKSTVDFKETKAVGDGYLIDHSRDTGNFLKFGAGLGRFATIELWNAETNVTKTIASDDQKYYYDASFLRKGKDIAILAGDGNYNVWVEVVHLDESDQTISEVLRLDYSEKRWIPKMGGKQLKLKLCK